MLKNLSLEHAATRRTGERSNYKINREFKHELQTKTSTSKCCLSGA